MRVTNKIVQLYSCVVMACATNLYTIRINTDFYIILGQKYGLPFKNCDMYVNMSSNTCHFLYLCNTHIEKYNTALNSDPWPILSSIYIHVRVRL